MKCAWYNLCAVIIASCKDPLVCRTHYQFDTQVPNLIIAIAVKASNFITADWSVADRSNVTVVLHCN